MAGRSIDVVIPTFNASATLGRALRSIAAQRYDGAVRVLCVDGGSTDHTRELAHAQGALVLDNPRRRQEDGVACGIGAARAELLLLLDADNELPHDRWLTHVEAALDLAEDVVAADCLFHTWRPSDSSLNRLFALIGGTDPIAIELGWSDRWNYHFDRWTTMPVQEEDRDSAILVRIDPERAPPMGSNGFLVRREELLKVDYRPFVHPNAVADLARRGWRFARVRDSVVHDVAPGYRALVAKVLRRTRRTRTERSDRRLTPRPSGRQSVTIALRSLTFVGTARHALAGHRRHPDRQAWALYPLVHALWTLAYVSQTLTTLLERRARR
ncbi:MAG TPA: glycosyltransferase [Solirubrobacteraceae bacterium]|nr:glycosyltransferase [Solirubrobacteraceae bacterium]